jgi:hypothetical protein
LKVGGVRVEVIKINQYRGIHTVEIQYDPYVIALIATAKSDKSERNFDDVIYGQVHRLYFILTNFATFIRIW